MGTYKTDKLDKALTKKGFRKESTHHEMYWLFVGERRSEIRTRISHGKKEYGDPLLGQMAKQMKLRRSQFDDFVECPLSQEDYINLLQQQGII